MKICILSDSHDNRPYLEAAVRAAIAAGAEVVLHCGDLVAPSTLEVIRPLNIPVHVIHGNNTGDLYMMGRVASKEANRTHYYGQDAGINLADRRIFMVHYPHYAEAMAATGDWDLVCCGHDHLANIHTVKNLAGKYTWLVNPGTVGGINAPATWVLGDLETMEFTLQYVKSDDRVEYAT
ncbi:MAG: metallophosphatase family protein [Gammaproteobacteria bacterium]|nr:metallophosphatase family protein [Gammaproteobacteria bacterium]MDH5513782.1 metallophosphatase family protein [Gammaproteobacteria bacterium]